MATAHADLGERTAPLPAAEWITPAQLDSDPYLVYERLRAESPVAWVPSVGKVLVTSFDGCAYAEQHAEIYSANIEKAHMVRALGGRPMLRKDDPDHARERNAVNPTLRPKAILEHWAEQFRAHTAETIDELEQIGPERADLNTDFARPLAAKNLISMLGFRDVTPDVFARWSADFIAGNGNVHDDPEIWARCERSRAEANDALDELLPTLLRAPDQSFASMLQQAGLDDASVRSNLFLAVSGGVNEPQHMMTSIGYLLSEHPDQAPGPDAEARAWKAVFNETARLYSPIGMVTRETTCDTVLEGVEIPAHSQIGLMLASANRDEQHYESPNRFRPDRSETRHLAFGSGTHICAGKWAAETAVGQIAMPELYRRLPQLRVDAGRSIAWKGWAFRGLTALPVTW